MGASVATTGALHVRPSAERLTSTADRSPATASETTSHVRWSASYATLGSLTTGKSPRGLEFTVRLGRKPRRQVRPASSEVAKPMFAAAPPKIRPTWNTSTTVDPAAALSGSTSVWCWLSGLR